jgi:hypothetical protein
MIPVAVMSIAAARNKLRFNISAKKKLLGRESILSFYSSLN